MKIQNLTYKNISLQNIKTNSIPFKNKANAPSDSSAKPLTTIQQQSIEIQKKQIENEYKAFLNKKGKVTYEEYQRIVKENPAILLMAQRETEKNKKLLSTPRTIAKAAVLIKKFFDEKYQKDYKVISMGTSPAPIAEVMQAMGADVVYAPITGLTNYFNTQPNEKYYYNLDEYPNIRKVLMYLKSKGIKEDDKTTYVLIDYCSTGTSLILFRDMIMERNNISKEKMHDFSIINLLEAARKRYQNKYTVPSKEDISDILSDMQFNLMENVCSVPHFDIRDNKNQNKKGYITSKDKNLDKLFEEFEEYSKPEARAFALCAINEADKLNKKNPD